MTGTLPLQAIIFQILIVHSSTSTAGTPWSFLGRSLWDLNPSTVNTIDSQRKYAHGLSINIPPLALNIDTEASHYEAIQLYRALGSKSSCHAEATSSLLIDCSTLKSDSLDESIKVHYAVKLAICEFTSTGVGYPSECKKLGNTNLEARKTSASWKSCVKKLEEKPQHWTTLSNNIQNAMALCSAARHDVEKEELLLLHINITKVQQSLLGVIQTQLNTAWTTMQAKAEWDAEVIQLQQRAHEALQELRETAVNIVRGSNDQASAFLEGLVPQLRSSQETSVVLSQELRGLMQYLVEASSTITSTFPNMQLELEGLIQAATDEQNSGLRENQEIAEKLKASIELTEKFMTDHLSTSVRELSAGLSESFGLLHSIQSASKSLTDSFETLSNSYQDLEATESHLLSSVQLQQSLHEKMLFSIEKAMENADNSMSSLFEGVEKLKHTVETIDQKVYSFTSSNRSIFFTCLIGLMMFIIILSKKPISWGLGVFSGLWAFAMATILVNEPKNGYLRNNMRQAATSGLLYPSTYELSTSPTTPHVPEYFLWTTLSTLGWLTTLPMCYLLYRHNIIATTSQSSSGIEQRENYPPKATSESRKRIGNLCLF